MKTKVIICKKCGYAKNGKEFSPQERIDDGKEHICFGCEFEIA